MSYGNVQYFLPGESYFKEPGTYEAMLRAEGQKKASYMADINAFYTELEEMSRQFNLSLDLQNRELAQQADQFAKALKHQRFFDWASLGVEAAGIGANIYLGDKGITYPYSWFGDMADKYFDWERLFPEPESVAETMLDIGEPDFESMFFESTLNDPGDLELDIGWDDTMWDFNLDL